MEKRHRHWNNNWWSNSVFCMKNSLSLKSSYFEYALYALMGLIVFIPIIGSILKSSIDCDAAYYVCMGERIVDGVIPYKEYCTGYTPLWFYIEAAFKVLFYVPDGIYWPYLVLFYSFQVAGAYFLYRLIRCLEIKKTVALFSAWLYLLMSHWLQGNFLLLEVPSVTFCLFACWLVLEYRDRCYWHYLWIGVIASCSFLVKQFGLGTFALCLYLMLFISKCNWKQFVSFTAGYAIPILLCLAVWGDAFINDVLLNGYGSRDAVEAGYDVSIANKLLSIVGNLKYFCYMVCPIICVGWLFAPLSHKQNRLIHLIFSYCGILGYSLIFYFTGGQLHYYQYLLPFAIVLIAELVHITQNSMWRYFVYVMIVWVVFVSAYKTYNNRVYKQYIKGTERVQQQKLAREVLEYVGEDETLFVVHGGLFHLYFQTNVLPPNLSTIGYNFGPMGLNEKDCAEQINTADWVVRYSKDYPYESFFTDSLKHELERYPAISLRDSAILLHKMH